MMMKTSKYATYCICISCTFLVPNTPLQNGASKLLLMAQPLKHPHSDYVLYSDRLRISYVYCTIN